MKNKKPLIAVVAAFVIIAIGATVAYYTSNVILANQFEMATYQTEATETFTSPNNWKPCDETPKTISVTNHGTVDVAVRVKLEDFWQDKDGNDLPDLMKDDQKLTSINFHNGYENYWEKKGSWYVYKTDLAPNATTQPLIDSVSLSCEANLTTATTYSADGKTAQTGESPYAGGKFHVKATVQTIQADAAAEEWSQSLAKMMQRKVNNLGNYQIDFARTAVKSDDITTANGNGINKYTENGADIYYYRGNIDDNNVIWADICWKIVRTTATGGVKMIYNGEPTTVGTAKQCTATGTATQINAATYKFNNYRTSPADVGYMYGVRITNVLLSSGGVFTFSNDVSKNGDTYTLDTSTGQSISGTWANERANAATRYHYFCKNNATSCSNKQIGYIYYYGDSRYMYYFPVNGYENIEDMKNAMFANTNDSIAKATIESWFETKNLDGHISGSRNYEDDLEDAVFCNDRSYYSGALKGKDSDATPSGDTQYSYHGAYGRNRFTTDGNYTPSLDCANSRDAFQVSNNDAKLNHKVGLITADELTLAGMSSPVMQNNYLYNSDSYAATWSASPYYFSYETAFGLSWNSKFSPDFSTSVAQKCGLRPMVSLKAGTEFTSGTGLTTDPYIVP